MFLDLKKRYHWVLEPSTTILWIRSLTSSMSESSALPKLRRLS